MKQQIDRNLAFVVLAMMGGILGCEQQARTLYPARGILTYEGKPVSGAYVNFRSDEENVALGVTDEQGRFELRTQGLPGAVLGPQRVFITKVRLVDDSADESRSEASVKATSNNKSVPAAEAEPDEDFEVDEYGEELSEERELKDATLMMRRVLAKNKGLKMQAPPGGGPPPGMSSATPVVWLIPERYGNVETSELRFEVTEDAEANVFEIAIAD